MLDDKLPVTLQYQLHSTLLAAIEARTWAPGEQIPSERELCEAYGISRITVREVLKQLVQEGYLVRKQGKGTFVALPKFEHELTSAYSLSQDIEKEGLESRFQLLSYRTLPVPEALLTILRLQPGDYICEVTRLRWIGDEPFAWERACLPRSFMEGASEEQLVHEGLYATLFRYSGLIAETAEVEVEAVNCPADIAALLELKKRAAVLHLTRVTIAQNHPVEYCESYVRSEKYKYKYKQTLRKKTFNAGAEKKS